MLDKVKQILSEDDGIGNEFQKVETIAWLIYLRFIDYLEKTSCEQAGITGDEYRLVVAGNFAWDYWTNSKVGLTGDSLLKFVAEKLFPELCQVDGVSDISEPLRSIFQNISLYSKSGYKLRDAIDVVNSGIELSHEALPKLRSAFEEVVYEMTIDSNKHHRHFTPRPLCNLLVGLVNPELGKTIYDPACGSCGFLEAAFSHLEVKANTPDKVRVLEKETFYGRDKNPLQYVLGLISLSLRGIHTPRLQRANTLQINTTQLSDEGKYDYIFCNPTFDSDEGSMVQNNFSIQTRSVELMFLQHVERSLKTGGSAAIILPEGVFYRTNRAYMEVKKRLFEKTNVHTVISLPQIGVQTSILLFDKRQKSDQTWFFKFKPPEGGKLTKKNSYKYSYFKPLLNAYETREDTEVSISVPYTDIVANRFNISASTYIEDLDEPEFLLEPVEYLDHISDLLDQSKEEITKLRSELE